MSRNEYEESEDEMVSYSGDAFGIEKRTVPTSRTSDDIHRDRPLSHVNAPQRTWFPGRSLRSPVSVDNPAIGRPPGVRVWW